MEFFRQINQSVARIANTPALASLLSIASRLLLALIFIGAGYGKLGAGYEDTQQYMASAGVPGALLPLVILVELGGGIALLLGFQTRLAALALAVFSIVSAILFHGTPDQQIMFMKNLAMAGGLLALTLHGGGRLALDGEVKN